MDNRQIGHILVDRGVMRIEHVAAVLERQKQDLRPFGKLAESMFGITVDEVAAALAEQFRHRCSWVNLAHQNLDPQCLIQLEPAQAWDHLLLPLRYENGELIFATALETLEMAIALLQRYVYQPFHLVLCEMRQLEQFIAERYDYEGIELRVDEAA